MFKTADFSTDSDHQASGHTGISGLIMSWVNELNSHDNESTLERYRRYY